MTLRTNPVNPIRIGVLGCGMIGQAFVRQAASHPSFQVVGLHSRSLASAERAAVVVPEATVHASRRDFFADRRLEAILVCTPHSSHAADGIDCMAHGKHVLLEKPIATSGAELDLLEKTVVQTGLSLLALPHDQYPYLAAAGPLLGEQYLGKLTSFHSVLDVPGPPRANWYYSPEAVGGAAFDTLPYALCRLLGLLRANVRLVLSFHSQLLRRRRCLDGDRIEPAVDDNATLILELSDGQQAVVRSNWNTSRPEDYLLAQGRRGDLRVDCWTNTLRIRSPTPPPLAARRVDWDGSEAYEVALPPFNHERLKLDLFATTIRQRTSNIRFVSYAMRLILSSLGDGTVPPLGVYSEEQKLSNLILGDDYL